MDETAFVLVFSLGFVAGALCMCQFLLKVIRLPNSSTWRLLCRHRYGAN